ncbi:MAG: ABC transporter permease [Deltaproteobacteria bacterium CG11_big_fil_rev_8_21_14_0_20_47_16]|nr:MAG: ABC transporter permease [Deltaproteobacteria bacterium CG11_big_fil_rev_8_21_14_0_20_47_16]
MAINACRGLGNWSLFVWEAMRWLTHAPYRMRLYFQQMEFIGVRSVPIIALTGLFVGAVFGLQTGKAFALFNAETLVGATIGLSLAREIGPVFTALMVTARACSAMAAELGTMRVTEQIDALETMAVDPIHYLVVPRVVAATLMTPLLTGIFIFIGVFGGYLVGVQLLNIDEGSFLNKLYYYVDVNDLIGGLVKSAFFGFAISLISCYQGFNTRNGAEGVGRATTQAVVISSVTILILDYFLTSWILHVFKSTII